MRSLQFVSLDDGSQQGGRERDWGQKNGEEKGKEKTSEELS